MKLRWIRGASVNDKVGVRDVRRYDLKDLGGRVEGMGGEVDSIRENKGLLLSSVLNVVMQLQCYFPPEATDVSHCSAMH